MKHTVLIYDIGQDKTKRRDFDDKEAADHYADDLKQILLNSANPAPVTIEVVPT
jgi:hypothetical protein